MMTPPTGAAGVLPGWIRPANRVVRAVSRLGLPMGTIRILTVPGRRTGVPRSTPVSPLTVDGGQYIVAGLAQGDWARNVRAAGHADLARGRRHAAVRLTEVTDPGLSAQVMRAFPAEVPGGVPMFVRLGLVQGADPAQFAAAAPRFAVFRIDPAAADRCAGDPPGRP
jgi:deazaflavin-dependent oxidoreductase (nitroreductase family)